MNKKLKITLLVIMTLILVGLGTYFIIKTFSNKEEQLVQQKFYGQVSKITDDYIELKEIDSNNILKINKSDDLKAGDYIVIYYVKGKDIVKPLKKEILITQSQIIEDNINIEETTTITTTTTLYTTIQTTIKNTTQGNTQETTKKFNFDNLIDQLKNDYETVKTGEIKEGFKTSFIKIVDFIFYDEPINGLTFNSLKAETKAKVIYYALLIDSKIEKQFPQYKEKISDKYKNTKSKLYAKYLDYSTQICIDNKTLCSDLKNDFKFLKTTVSVTWDFLSDAIVYSANKGISAIKSWYEIYSGK